MTEINQETKESPKPDKAETVEHLMQGWTEADRQHFYETAQGSRLVPYNWFKNLEQADSKKPFNDKGLLDDKLGYLFPTNANGKETLPLGFVIDDRDIKPVATPEDKSRVPRLTDVSPAIPNEKWLGVNCAACHTAQIEFKGQAKRIDGGPGNSDFTGLNVSLRDAFKATLADPEKFTRFANKVIPGGTAEQQAELRKNVEQYTTALDGLVTRSTPNTPFGHGRIDAFALFLNEITGTAMDKPENYRVPDAPVSYPSIWGAPNLDWVQWNGSAGSPLGRNVGEVLGGFASLDLKAGSPQFSETTADLKNLYALEEYLKKLEPPKWPDSFGKLDQSSVDNGRKLFETAGCQSCHGTAPPETYKNKYGRELSKSQTTPLSIVKTDPGMAMNFLLRKADPGAFKDKLGGKDEVPIALLLELTVGTTTQSEFKRESVTTPQEMLKMNDYREDLNKISQDLAGYKASSLEGIWATAPYLHNGSVPTLYDLLQPPDKRPAKFMVGSREYDPVKVGLVSDKGKDEIDTHLKGNSNAGHDFGTNLSEKEKMDLIEYLKSR